MATLEPAVPATKARHDVRAVHDAHADFVWRSLQRLGIRHADLEDAMQEVFVVVHKKLASFDGRVKLTTWLFAICMRVASNWRRRAHLRREQSVDVLPDVEGGPSPLEHLERERAKVILMRALDALDEERRAIFVMFELESMTSEEIGQVLAIPVGTVYSRLHRARADFREALAREKLRQGRTP